MLKEEIISEIELRIYRGKPSDDADIGRREIISVMDDIRAAMIKRYLDEEKDVPSEVLKRFDCVATTTESPVCLTDDCFARHVIDLPVKVLQLERDLGVFRVQLQGAEFVLNRIYIGELDIVKHSKWARPSEDDPAWFKIGNKIYFVGKSFKNKKVLLDLVPATTGDVKDDEEYPLPDYLVNELTNEAVEELLAQQNLGVYDLQNDGKDGG